MTIWCLVGLCKPSTNPSIHSTATSLPALRFAIRVGPRVSQDLFDDLKKKAKAHHHVSLERNSLEFLKELSAAKVSISQGGYNSVMETVAMKMSGKAHPKRSVVVPIAEGPRKKDIEQELRARKFLEAGLVDYVILEEDLTVGTLVSTIKHAFSAIDSGGERESYDKAGACLQCTQCMLISPLSSNVRKLSPSFPFFFSPAYPSPLLSFSVKSPRRQGQSVKKGSRREATPMQDGRFEREPPCHRECHQSVSLFQI